MKRAGRSTSGRVKPSRICALTSTRSWTRISPGSALPLKRRSARWRPKRRATRQRKHAPSRGRQFPWRALPMATKFNPATTVSTFHRTKMIGRRFSRAGEYQYSCAPRRMTTQMFRPSRSAALTALITTTTISRARAGQAVSSA